ncbi:MAG: hypothetical protein B6D70_07690 [gamma proteobacterium symbiont of Stewartia floridana]|nr:MAG: hypothetical protein B6D70_07690 [gamma proteobacterium symbiont of Stewartia floridana]
MKKNRLKPPFRLVTNDTDGFQPDRHSAQVPKREVHNLAVGLMQLLEIPQNNTLVALIGHGDEQTNLHALRTWLKPRYHRYQELKPNARLNQSSEELMEFVREISDRY